MAPKKGKGRAKRSHPDAERQVNVHVDIQQRPYHPMQVEQHELQSSRRHQRPSPEPTPSYYICDWSYKSLCHLWLVMQPVVAICDCSCNQLWRSAIGCTINRSDLWLVLWQPIASLAINLWNNTTSHKSSHRKTWRPVVAWPNRQQLCDQTIVCSGVTGA